MVLTATAPPDLLAMLKSILIDPAVYKASVDRPNITFTTRKSKFGGKIPKAVMNGKTSAGKTILLLTYHKSNIQAAVVTHTVHVICVQQYLVQGHLSAIYSWQLQHYGCLQQRYLYCVFVIDAYWQPLVEEVAAEIGSATTIIYVDCKKSAIDLATSFNQHTEIKTAAYTGEDTTKADKKSVLMNWSANEITLVVATSAFGLGVNKPDVRYVIHLGVPDSLESWMQKAGRGGRDGNNCVGMLSYLCIICSHSYLYSEIVFL